MKRASVLALISAISAMVLLFSGAMFAQVHGVPASVTSYAPTRSMAPGVPASVTSLGPRGYDPCSQPGCANAFFFYPLGATPASVSHPSHNGHRGGHHHHRPVTGGYAYIPYAYPVVVPVAVEPAAEPEDAVDDAAAPEEPEAPAPTIFERRPVAQPAPYAPVERAPETATASAEPPASELRDKHVNLSPVSEEKIPVVIVFKDGHQQEISNGNYAIVGDLLYDLSGPIAHKIKLADLDLAQTVQQNEQRGVEFSLPAAYKPQA